jgi:hypothetical protein
MNITDMLGKPVSDITDFDQPTTVGCSAPAAAEESPPRSARKSRLWMVAASLTALIVSFGAGAYLTSSTTRVPPMLPPPAATGETVPPNIGDFAELFVALHLTGLASPSDVAGLYTGNASDIDGSTGLWVNRSAAVSSRPLGEDVWSVTVVVDALEMVDGAYETAGLQYFDVTIAAGDDQPIAVSAPSRIPNPPAVSAPPELPTFNGAVPADQAAAVTSFLEAHLTGQGEVARFVSPTTRIPLFAEAPYESIAVTHQGADPVGRVMTHVAATTGRGARHDLEYTLELTFESGVWEVSDLVPAVGETR